MPFQIHKAIHRQYIKNDWLKSYRTVNSLKNIEAIEENYVKPAVGFPIHTYRNIEIISIILSGGMSHQDDSGNLSVLHTGDVQIVSAGQGITQSELNAFDSEELALLQIYLKPDKTDLNPNYQNKHVELQVNSWNLIASHDGREGSMYVNQMADIYLAELENEKKLNFSFAANQAGWLQVIDGNLALNDFVSEKGDGIRIDNTSSIEIKALSQSKILLLVFY